MVSNNKKSSIIGKKHYFLVLALTFIVNFDSTVVIPIISNYAISLGASIILASFIVGAYSIAHIPSNIISGRLVDKLGRKGLIAIGVIYGLYYLSKHIDTIGDRKILKEEFMKDYIKVGDVVRVRENIFIDTENNPRIKVGEKGMMVLHRTPSFAKIEFLGGNLHNR